MAVSALSGVCGVAVFEGAERSFVRCWWAVLACAPVALVGPHRAEVGRVRAGGAPQLRSAPAARARDVRCVRPLGVAGEGVAPP